MIILLIRCSKMQKLTNMNNPQFYLSSPSSNDLQCEIYEGIIFIYGHTPNDMVNSFGICLSPACDLCQRKADYVKFAQFIGFETFYKKRFEKELLILKNSKDHKKKSKIKNNIKSILTSIVRNKIPRYYFIPLHKTLPDSLIDFQRITSLSIHNLREKKKYASIDSPYVEAILNRYCAYSMRIGTPDYFADHQNRIIQKYSPA